ERLWPGRSATVSELGGGITNRNFKVDMDGEVFVLRMGGAKTELLGIDRAVEYAAGRRAFEVGVGPEVVHFEPADGWLVSRFFDLANFSVNHEFSVEDDRRFLAAYFGAERESDVVAVRLMRYMSDFREAMWGVLQSGISDLDFDFNGYAAKHFARMEASAGELQLNT